MALVQRQFVLCTIFIYNWFPDVFKANSYQIRQFGLPNKLSSFITQVLLLAILHSVSTQSLCYTKIYMGLRECPCGVFQTMEYRNLQWNSFFNLDHTRQFFRSGNYRTIKQDPATGSVQVVFAGCVCVLYCTDIFVQPLRKILVEQKRGGNQQSKNELEKKGKPFI